MCKGMDFLSIHLRVNNHEGNRKLKALQEEDKNSVMSLLITVCHKVNGFQHRDVGRIYKSSCTDIGYRLQNCTQSPNYRLVDNMPIVMNATEIKLFCLDKDVTLDCIENIVTACKDTLKGISAIIYDLRTFETTYNTLCGNMELTWWSETSCILQLDRKLHDCRRMKERILAEVQRTGLSDIYCEKLDDLYSCNTFHPDSVCKQQFSDYLARFYRMMLTPSFCDAQLTSDKGVYRKVTANILSSTDASASNADALTLWSFSMVLCAVLVVAVVR